MNIKQVSYCEPISRRQLLKNIQMKTKFLFIFVASCFIFVSCDLNEKPYGFYSDDNFYKTKEDAQSALYYAYNALNYNEIMRATFYINELATETTDVKGEEGFGSQELNNWSSATFGTNEQLELNFKYYYVGINRTNAVIDNVSSSTFNQTDKNRILGEAYFLRAWEYFNLVKNYGIVPLQKKSIKTVAQTYPAMAKSIDEVYNFIISDCMTSESLLKVNRVTGCVDKVAAQSLLAKVYLVIASAKESNVKLYKDMNKDITQMYDSASYWSHKVLYDQTVYSMDTTLLNIYNSNKPDGPEHIFILAYDRSGTNEGEFSSIDKLWIPYASGSPLWFPNPDGTYTKATNQGWGVFLPTDAFVNSYDNADKRKTQLLSKRYYTSSDGKTFKDNTNYITRKYIDPDYIGVRSTVRPYFIRFSEVALIYAEAQGPTIEGYKWLNKIRTRAGLLDASAVMGVDDFRNYVVQERAFELAFEGQRLLDLRRKAMVTKVDPKAMAAGISEEDAAFYPIPQKEIDLNTSN